MEDLGAPVAYLVVSAGVPVWDGNGAQAGTVVHMLADEDVDIFHGLILDTPDGYRFADAGQVKALYERGVRLAVAADRLHALDDDPVADEFADDGNVLQVALRQARRWLGHVA